MAQCRDCGRDDLEWLETAFGWLLYGSGRPHICGKRRRWRAVQAFYRGLYDVRRSWRKAA